MRPGEAAQSSGTFLRVKRWEVGGLTARQIFLGRAKLSLKYFVSVAARLPLVSIRKGGYMVSNSSFRSTAASASAAAARRLPLDVVVGSLTRKPCRGTVQGLQISSLSSNDGEKRSTMRWQKWFQFQAAHLQKALDQLGGGNCGRQRLEQAVELPIVDAGESFRANRDRHKAGI